MKTHRLFQLCALLSTLVIAESVQAQITIQKTDFQKIFAPQAILKFHSDTSKQVNVGKTGGPNVYDFSALTFTDTVTQYVHQSSEVPFLATRFDASSFFWTNSYPHADGAPVAVFGTTTFESLGEVTITDTSQEMKYHVPHEIIGQFPFSYNQSWGTTGAGLGTDSVWINGILKNASGGWNSAESTFVDGYGTLILLGQSHQCLRIRQVEPNSYTHKGFSYFTKDGIALLIDSDKSQNDTGKVAVQGINIIAATTVTAVNEPDATPREFELEQNYPNPFNPTTAISYQLSAVSKVTLKVYDVLGREVATLVDGEMNAGMHEVTFDASRLASGIYLYQVRAGAFTATRKLLLLK